MILLPSRILAIVYGSLADNEYGFIVAQLGKEVEKQLLFLNNNLMIVIIIYLCILDIFEDNKNLLLIDLGNLINYFYLNIPDDFKNL